MEQKFLISNKSYIETYSGKLGGLLIRNKFQVPYKAGSLYRDITVSKFNCTRVCIKFRERRRFLFYTHLDSQKNGAYFFI